MPRSRLMWRALAVLGALLSTMVIEWSVGLAIPVISVSIVTATAQQSTDGIDGTEVTNYNTTNIRRPISSASNFIVTMTGVNNVSDNSKHQQRSINNSNHTLLRSDDNYHSSNSPNIMPIYSDDNRKLSSSITEKMTVKFGNSVIINKRMRKKNVYRVTAATLRNFRTPHHQSDVHSDSIDNISNSDSHNSDNIVHYDHDQDVTTVDPEIYETTTTVYHFLSRTDRSVHKINEEQQQQEQTEHQQQQQQQRKRQHQRQRKTTNLDRNERSANLSHISGPARKIQLYIKNRFIQLLPDGTINGTQDDFSDYTILQRTTVDVGQIKIQGVATCLYLCMDQCGTVYGSKAFTDDCVFNESMEQHHYNTYSSTYNSNSRRTLYLALNRHGEPRKLQIPPTRPLGKLATYTKALTETVTQERVEQLIAKTFGANRIKHGLRQLCDAGKPLVELTTKVMKGPPKCNMNATAAAGAATGNGQNVTATAVNEKFRISNNNSNSMLNNSNNNNNSHHNNGTTSIISSHGQISHSKKKKKKRRCRPADTTTTTDTEQQDATNCSHHKTGPQALKKRPQKNRCSPTAEEGCRRKSNKKQNHHHHQHHNHQQQSNKQNGGGNGNGGGGGSNGSGGKKNKKQNGQNGKKGKNNAGGKGRNHTPMTTTTTPTPITTTTTIYQSLMITSTEYQSIVEDETEGDDNIGTGASAETEDDEDTSAAGMTSMGGQTNLVDSGEDLLYDGEFDVFNIRLWRLVLFLWIATWSLRVGRCLL